MLDDSGDALPDADAHGDHAEAGIATAHFVNERGHETGPSRAERVTEGDRAAVRIDLGGVESELANAGHGLRGEGFVELDQIEINSGEPRALERFACRGHGADAHDSGVDAGHG